MINLRVFECFKSVCLISGLHVITSDLSILYVKHISHIYIYISVKQSTGYGNHHFTLFP